ncbi:MAG TPA: kynureninase [Gammaproteobacteria bacterium]|nr:kynureninase [Gammaproteobacteria bacterium]
MSEEPAAQAPPSMGAGFAPGAECAAALDEADGLAAFRESFELPRRAGRPLTYLCGHSLGPLPRAARRAVEGELERWSERAVEGHFESDGWLRYHERFAAPLARLAGAKPAEVVAMNTLTVNLHLMLASFFAPTADRYKILIERDAFPSDRFAVESQLRWHGLDPREALLELAPEPGTWTLDIERLGRVLATEGERIALLLLPGVQYLSGEALDVPALTALAHRHGCRIGFDLAHAIGNVPLELHEAGADFAVWCSYKYLNAGPGAVGGCFVHERWHDAGLPRLEGWWGTREARRFDGAAEFAPMPGAAAWQLSNPPVLSLAPLSASLSIFERAGLASLRAKSERLTAYLEYLLAERLGDRARILTPRDPARRGCQLSLRLDVPPDAASRVPLRLRDAGVVVDWREPAILRIAPAPLYNRFGDAFEAVEALAAALE